MTVTEAIKHFGNMSKVAKELETSRSHVWRWRKFRGDQIPAKYAARLHVLTDGRLNFDINEYGRETSC